MPIYAEKNMPYAHFLKYVAIAYLHKTAMLLIHCNVPPIHSYELVTFILPIRTATRILTLYLSGSVTCWAKMSLARSWLSASPMMYSVTGRVECWNNERTVSVNFVCRSRLCCAFVNVIMTFIGNICWSTDVTSVALKLDSASLSTHSSPRHTSWKLAPKTVEWPCSDAYTINAHVRHNVTIMKIYFRLMNSIPTENVPFLSTIVVYKWPEAEIEPLKVD